MIGRDEIEVLIPHAGSMCLLDRVVEWDGGTIRCAASSHRDPANPLRVGGSLGAACGVEYAAQAMAVHGGLTRAGAAPKAGYLISLRNLTLHVARLDDIAGELVIDVERLGGEASCASYGFAIRSGETLLLEGRAMVLLDAGDM